MKPSVDVAVSDRWLLGGECAEIHGGYGFPGLEPTNWKKWMMGEGGCSQTRQLEATGLINKQRVKLYVDDMCVMDDVGLWNVVD
jgi:hypothetical protein